MNSSEDLLTEARKNIGRTAQCAHGRIGRVQRVRLDKKGRVIYFGRGFNGRSWQTTQPFWTSCRIGDN